MYFVLQGADFSQANLGQIEIELGSIGTGGTIDPNAKYTLTVNVNVEGATIKLTPEGGSTTTTNGTSGTIEVTYNTKVNIEVSKEDYNSYNRELTITRDRELSVTLTPIASTTQYTLTITPDPSDATVTLNNSVRNSITVDANTEVNWSVEKENYVSQSGKWIATKNEKLNITLATEGSTPVNPPSKPEVTTGTLPLVQNALSVVSGENFYHVGTVNKARMSTSSVTEETGIWVDAGATITLTGTSGLRFDYVYATKPGPNSNDKTVNTIGGVGTASNFVNSDYFPLNADGSSNTISITNDKGTGYYYFFAIAAPNKSNQILVANYQGKITYTVTPANDTPSGDIISSGALFLQNGALSVVKGENFFVSLNSDTSKTKRMNSSSLTEATGILVPNGKTITLTGTSGLRFDYVYATKAGPNSSTDKSSNVIGGVGTASNFVSSNYFPLNANGSSNTISVTNNYGQDYYYHFAIAGPNKNEVLNPSDYNITYVVS